MKINPVSGNYNINGIYKTNGERKNDSVKESSQSKSSIVQISDKAKTIAKKINESENADFPEKVEAIRKSIQNNSYVASSEEIADKILEKIDLERKGLDE